MTDRDVVTAKLAELEDRLGRVRANVRATASELASDRDASDLVAFNLMLAVQTCLDVASHVIADERWAPAATLAESFHRLAERGVITAETDAALGRAASLRNVVAHGYGRVVSDILFTAATHGVLDLERFAREVAAWMARRPT